MSQIHRPVVLVNVRRRADEAKRAMDNARFGSPLAYVLSSQEDVLPMAEEIEALRAEVAQLKGEMP